MKIFEKSLFLWHSKRDAKCTLLLVLPTVLAQIFADTKSFPKMLSGSFNTPMFLGLGRYTRGQHGPELHLGLLPHQRVVQDLAAGRRRQEGAAGHQDCLRRQDPLRQQHQRYLLLPRRTRSTYTYVDKIIFVLYNIIGSYSSASVSDLQ